MSSKATPRQWVRLDLAFLEQDNVRDVGERFGPGGPLVLLALVLEAKRAAMAGAPVEQQGTVSLRYAALGRMAFVDESQARTIVASLVGLELIQTMTDDDRRFTARLTKWGSWEPRDSGGAARQHRYRERRDVSDDDEDGIPY